MFSWGIICFEGAKEFHFQDVHNQAGIARSGGIVPFLKLLGSKNGSLQHNAAFALYGLADNEVQFWCCVVICQFRFKVSSTCALVE